MKILNVHKRTFDATPEQLAALVADLDVIWPKHMGRPPRPEGGGRLRAGPMVWQEFDRPGAARAWRVVSPPQLQGHHRFEIEPVEGGTVLRHTVDAEVADGHEALWTEGIEPGHDLLQEAILDNVGRLVAAGGREP